MTLCPIAIAVGCQKCPAFKICPLKGLIGDKPAQPAPEVTVKAKPQSKPKAKSGAKRAPKSRAPTTTRK